MRRSAVLLVMLFAMLWQSVAMARLGSTVNVLVDQQHTALHWQEESHHHDDDGSYQLDDSPEAVQHVLSDQLSTCTALVASASQQLQRPGALPPRGLLDAPAPQPFLDGLLRPPSARS